MGLLAHAWKRRRRARAYCASRELALRPVRCPRPLPALHRRLQLEPLGDAYGAVEHDPRHHFGIGEVLARAACLPDSVVGLAPDRLDVLHDRPPAGPEPFLDPAQRLGADDHDSEDLAVHVELELPGSGVADPDRPGSLVPGKLLQLKLGQPALAPDPVHDLDLRRVTRAHPHQKVAERQRLGRVTGGQQRLQREHRVAQPAEAVIPVAHAADVLRQRRCRRRDHRAGRLTSPKFPPSR